MCQQKSFNTTRRRRERDARRVGESIPRKETRLGCATLHNRKSSSNDNREDGGKAKMRVNDSIAMIGKRAMQCAHLLKAKMRVNDAIAMIGK